MTCRYCGLETGSGVGHRSQTECIEALNREIERAKRLIDCSRQHPSPEHGNSTTETAAHRTAATEPA